MRKLILISAAAVLLASASAQADQINGLALAAADTPAATSTDSIPQPLPPVAKSDSKSDSKSDAKPQASAPARPLPSRTRSQARDYSSDEAKARRIAAKYGFSW
jgi:hypothetical protein